MRQQHVSRPCACSSTTHDLLVVAACARTLTYAQAWLSLDMAFVTCLQSQQLQEGRTATRVCASRVNILLSVACPTAHHTPALQVDNCPQQNGVPYAVDGYPGTPYLQTPFSTLYHAAPHAQPSITVCRNSQPDPKHCMSAFEITINRVLKRPFDTTIPSCTAFPATELFGYNGEVPGPTITQPV